MKAQEIIDVLMKNPDAEVSILSKIGDAVRVDAVGAVTLGFNTILIQSLSTIEMMGRPDKKVLLEVVK